MRFDHKGMVHFSIQSTGERFQTCLACPVIRIGFIVVSSIDRVEFFSNIDFIQPTLRGLEDFSFFTIIVEESFSVGFLMLVITLFTHQYTIVMYIHLIEQGMTKIVTTIHLFRVIGI